MKEGRKEGESGSEGEEGSRKKGATALISDVTPGQKK